MSKSESNAGQKKVNCRSDASIEEVSQTKVINPKTNVTDPKIQLTIFWISLSAVQKSLSLAISKPTKVPVSGTPVRRPCAWGFGSYHLLWPLWRGFTLTFEYIWLSLREHLTILGSLDKHWPFIFLQLRKTQSWLDLWLLQVTKFLLTYSIYGFSFLPVAQF